MANPKPRITIEEFRGLWPTETPFMQFYRFAVERIGYGEARVRLGFDDRHIRPGGTLSGPTIMALADYTIWGVVLGMKGPDYHAAATSSLTVHFLRPAQAGDLIAVGRIIRLGRRQAVGEASVYTEGAADGADPVAHVTATYAIPSRRKPAGSGSR
jgi:uncharacterized protein (TIGR00369 family)